MSQRDQLYSTITTLRGGFQWVWETVSALTHANHMRGRALTYGQDALLLATRAQLLRADGYRTDTAANLRELRSLLLQNSDFDIVILCHTVSKAESEQIQSAVQGLGKPLLVMTTLMAPSEFLKEVARLTGKEPVLGES